MHKSIKTTSWVLACLSMIGPSDFSQTDTKTGKIEKQIIQLEELGRAKALRGEINWDDLMAEGAYLIQGDGSVMIYQKGQNLSSMRLTAFKISDLIVRVYGDTVVATGLSDASSETAEKRPFSFQMRYLNVWKHFGSTWKIVVAERTMIRPFGK